MSAINRGLERRAFLRNAVTTAGALAGLPAVRSLNLLAASGRRSAPKGMGGYGALAPVADERDGVSASRCPKGSSTERSVPAGAVMSDGNKVPLAHDGMGVFNTADGKFRLVRNHEDRNNPGLGSTAARRQCLRRPGRRRHDDARRQSIHARAGARLHQPERDHRQLRRRSHAVGLLDHVRRDERRDAVRLAQAARVLLRRPGLRERLGAGRRDSLDGPVFARGGHGRSQHLDRL